MNWPRTGGLKFKQAEQPEQTWKQLKQIMFNPKDAWGQHGCVCTGQ